MEIVFRAALMYLIVLILLRLTTQRIMRSATPLDMVVIFFFGGMAVPPILGDDRSITGAVLALCTIAGLHMVLSHLKRIWPTIGMVTEGNPVVIYSNGTWDDEQMRRRRVDARISWLRCASRASRTWWTCSPRSWNIQARSP